MDRTRLASVLMLLGCIATASAAGVTARYVSPDGDDAGPGTLAAPWRTIAHARDALRPVIAAGLEQYLIVVLAPGTYELNDPLVFTPDDGGTAERSVRYEAALGAEVSISGGRRISDWQPAEGGLWTTTVTGVAEGDWYP